MQENQRGTGDAVMAARSLLEGFEGDVLVAYGDTPLVTAKTLGAMVQARGDASDPAVVVLGMRPPVPGAYGRLILGADGGLDRDRGIPGRLGRAAGGHIVQCRADGVRRREALRPARQHRQRQCEGGVLPDRRGGGCESRGHACRVVEADADEVVGVNSRAELADVERLMQRRLRAAAMADGATLADPETVYFSHDTRLGRDVVVGAERRIRIRRGGRGPGRNQALLPSGGSHRRLGRYHRPLRPAAPGAEIGADAKIGNFVEIKNARILEGAKVNHLTYIGDATVGAKANIGAGTITCNYDGFFKNHTEIGAGAFIGSNSSLVAPVTIGDGAIIGAGSVVTRDVPAASLAVTRSQQSDLRRLGVEIPHPQRGGKGGQGQEVNRARITAHSGMSEPDTI